MIDLSRYTFVAPTECPHCGKSIEPKVGEVHGLKAHDERFDDISIWRGVAYAAIVLLAAAIALATVMGFSAYSGS